MTSYPQSQDAVEPVAIIGVAGRYPGDAANPDKLWELLCNGKSAMTEVPKDRFNVDGFYHPHGDRQGSINFRGGHFMKRNPAAFDAPFFSITPSEAKAMDPQQRMCLEVAYEAMENAGVRMEDVVGSTTACYVGCFSQDYLNMALRDPETFPKYNACGTAQSYLSNRVSWFYDLRGPSISIDTACSSSLVALHLACQSIRTGESEMALAGGVNFMISPEMNFPMTFLHMLSADSISQSFDEKANGYSRGEGAAFVIVKSLSAALRDNDIIRAVIRNTATNQDGKTPGITLPSAQSQEAMIRRAYQQAGLDLATTGYFEAHGTGTPAGDPLETSALAAAFGKARAHGDPLYVGSIKANIGHLEGASGIAGLTKAIYIMEKGMIPPQVWLDRVNPKIPLDQWNLAIPRKLMKWPGQNLRRISVNSFGFGGANAHCILDDAYHYLRERNLQGRHNTTPFLESASPASPSSVSGSDSGISMATLDTPFEDLGPSKQDANVFSNSQLSELRSRLRQQTPKLCVWSSHEQSGISRVAETYAAFLSSQGKISVSEEQTLLKRFAYTLSSRRSVLPWKTFAVGSTTAEICGSLTDPPKAKRSAAQTPKLAMVFTGQGAQHHAMARELLGYKVFSDSIDAASAHLSSLGCPWNLMSELTQDEATSRINQPAFSQPICTAIQIAMLDLLDTWNVRPSAVVGHSSGEIAAAYAKKALGREDAWTVAYERGRLSSMIPQTAPHLSGSMLAAGIGEEEAQSYLEKVTVGKAGVACSNSPKSVTISGDLSAVLQVEAMLKADNIFARRLKVETAYHSFHMDVIAKDYLEALNSIKTLPEDASAPKMFSSVTGKYVNNSELGANYWVANMVSKVKFSSALKSLLEHSDTGSKRRNKSGKPYVNLLLELGPSGALQGPIKQVMTASKFELPSLSALHRGKDCGNTILQAAGRLFQEGMPVDIAATNRSGYEHTTAEPQLLVNMPPYPWNHTNEYWHNSALANNYYFRKHPRKDLVGLMSLEGNSAEPRWRNFLRVSENPWLEDHVVHKTLLFPAAGMMAMAIEAMAQMCSEDDMIEGYELCDIEIGNALVIPRDDEGIETMLHFKLQPGLETDCTVWRRFDLYSRQGIGEWSRNCNGSVRAVTRRDPSCGTFPDESKKTSALYREKNIQITAQATKAIQPARFYEHSAGIGLEWGPLFQNITDLNTGDYCSTATIRVPDTKSSMPNQHEFEHVIHPCMLDTIIQMLLPATTSINEDMTVAAIPTYIGRLYVSTQIPRKSGASLNGYVLTEKTGFKGSESMVAISDASWQKPYVIFEKFLTTKLGAVNGNDDSTSTLATFRKLAGETVWKEDCTRLSGEKLARLLASARICEETPKTRLSEVEFAAFIYLQRALSSCPRDEVAKSPGHLLQYYDFMQSTLDKHQSSQWIGASAELENEILAKSGKADVEGAILQQLGEQLVPILKGTVSPISVLIKNNLLHDFEMQALGQAEINTKMTKLLQLLGHNNPGQKILEIGSRFGATTDIAMQALVPDSNQSPLFSSYTFTDVNPDFLDKAAVKYSDRSTYLNIQRLNIEKDPEEQNFGVGEYDVVLAFNFTHAITSLDLALQNARKLLKPGGKLVIAEVTNPGLSFPMILGSLPAWWMGSEDDRAESPNISTTSWNQRLRSNGFDGLGSVIPDWPLADPQRISLMVADATAPVIPSLSKSLVIVKNGKESEAAQAFSVRLCEQLNATGSGCEIAPLEQAGADDLSDKYVIMMAEIEEPILFDVANDDFETIRKIILESAGTLWLTKGAAMDSQDPRLNLITGLSRTVRAESPGLALTLLDLDPHVPLTNPANLDAVHDILHTLAESSAEKHSDLEFALRNETIFVPRIYPDVGTNSLTRSLNQVVELEDTQLSTEERSLTLKLDGSAGNNGGIGFDESDILKTEPAIHEVEISIQASGLDAGNLISSSRKMDATELSYGCSGVVTRCGANVNSFKTGDKVMTWTAGSIGTHVRAPETFVRSLPNHLTFEDGASIPHAFTTAYYALVDVARIREEETVLIHDAAADIGQAIGVLAKALGCQVLATVSDEQEKLLLMNKLKIPESRIFCGQNTDWVDGVKRAVGKVGVDVVVCGSGFDSVRLSTELTAWCGRLIDLQSNERENLDLSRLDRNASYARIDASKLLVSAPAKAARIYQKAMSLVTCINAQPVQGLTILTYSDLDKAVSMLKAGNVAGKIILKRSQDDIVKAVPNNLRPAKLSPEGTYLLVGGLGGLGRSLSQWMVTHGAKHLAFFSRSGASRPEAAQLIKDLQTRGINAIAYKCDVSNPSHVEAAVARCQEEMPRIRGVIQAAMSLADAPFHSMTHSQFRQSVDPKAQGSWNLHQYLPTDLDFMVMLSSCSGIVGTKGQSNYAAGNTFMDALAHHRNTRNMPTVSFDVGMVLGVGWVADHAELEEGLKRWGFLGLSELEFLSILNGCITGLSYKDNKMPCQIITGFGTGGWFKATNADIPDYLDDARWNLIRQLDTHLLSASATTDEASLSSQLAEATSLPAASELVTTALCGKLARWMMINAEDIDSGKTVSNYGVDSLVAVELRTWAFRDCGSEISVFDVMSNVPIRELSRKIAKVSSFVPKAILVGES